MSFELHMDRSYYRTRSFYIKHRKGVLSNNGNIIANGLPVFMHEYAHLIQDQYSVYGVIDFFYFIDTLHEIIRLMGKNKFIYYGPLYDQPDANDCWLTQLERLRSAARAHEKWARGILTFEDSEIRDIRITYKQETIDIPQVIGKFINPCTGTEYQHPIGVVEICEAYSMAVENIYNHQKTATLDEHSEFEYYAVERMLNKIGIIDSQSIIVICHWALQDHFPGKRLYELYNLLSEQKRKMSAYEIYDLCRGWINQKRFQCDINFYDQKFKDVISHHQGSAGEDDLLVKSIKWYHENAISNLRKLLDKNSYFPLDTCFAQAPPQTSLASSLDNLFQTCPLPQVEDPSRVYLQFGDFRFK